MVSEGVEKYFNQNAGQGGRNDPALSYQTELEEQWFSHHVPVRSGTHVLDFGCGTGRWTEKLFSQAGEIVAVDVAEVPLRTLESKHLPNVTVRRGNLEMLDEYSSAFDLILCSQVLEFISDPSLLFGKFHAALKAQGALFVSVWTPSLFTARREDDFLFPLDTAGNEVKLFCKPRSESSLRNFLLDSRFAAVKTETLHRFRHELPESLRGRGQGDPVPLLVLGVAWKS